MSNLITGIGVHLKVRSVAEARSFYEDFLELTPVFAYGNAAFLATIPSNVQTAPERYSGVTYEISGGAKIEIADGHIAVEDPEIFTSQIKSPKVSAMINVASLVPLLKKDYLGDKPKVTHYYWGTLEAVVRDPDGWVVVLISPFSEDELAEVSKLATVRSVEVRD
jgi:catechol 2,3-dioxygenase-like lactoylglutathione lyase family enzyme